MAHNLDRGVRGKLAMFSVNETPWHNEGHLLRKAPSLAEALELAGHDFEVEKRRLFVAVGGDDDIDDYVEVSDFKALVRTDRGTVLGVRTNQYTPLQNRDAFGILEPLLDKGLCTLETGGTIAEGRDVWMMMRFVIDHPTVQSVFGGKDKIIPFGLITNNHAGTRQVILMETPIRVVCENTLRMALHSAEGHTMANAIGIRHTKSVEAKLTEAAMQLWGDIIGRHVEIAKQFQMLKATHLDTATFRELVLDVAAPIPARLDKKKLTNRQETSREKIEGTRKIITKLWTGGIGHTGDHSAWEAFNGLVQALDHDNDAFRVRGGTRVAALINGRLARIKAQVVNGLMDHALDLSA